MTTWQLIVHLIPIELLHTLYMVGVATLFALLGGLPLGITLYQMRGQRLIYVPLNTLVNIGRSIPFAILIVAIIPITRWIVGTSIGTTASIVPLTVAALPFFARIVESSLLEVNASLVEAAYVMGSSPQQVIRKVLVPEALPSLIRGLTLTCVTLIGYSTLAGLVGGGGLGQIAIQYGYQRFNLTMMLVTLALLLALVEGVQGIGNACAKAILKKRGLLC